MVRSLVALVLLVAVTAGCDTEPSFDTVDQLYEKAGGEAWCDDDLRVTLEPFVGTCGDPTGDSRVVLGVGGGGQELRAGIDAAREHLTGDRQLLLVPTDPDRESGWQLRSRDRDLLAKAQERLGGVILDTEEAIDEWLGVDATAHAHAVLPLVSAMTIEVSASPSQAGARPARRRG